MLCNCCGERQADSRCATPSQALCFECAKPKDCPECCREYSEGEADGWQPGQDAPLCTDCRKSAEMEKWFHATRETIKAAASDFGWDVDYWTRAETGTIYLSLSRAIEDGDKDEESLLIRIADHQPNEQRYEGPRNLRSQEPDFDLIYTGGGHALDQVMARLKAK